MRKSHEQQVRDHVCVIIYYTLNNVEKEFGGDEEEEENEDGVEVDGIGWSISSSLYGLRHSFLSSSY